MRKISAMILSIMATLIIGLAPASAKSYVSIPDIRREVNNGWHETYTYKGEDICVDIDVEIPDVDKVPIVRVVMPTEIKAFAEPENADINYDYFDSLGFISVVIKTPHTVPSNAIESKKGNGWDCYGAPGYQAEFNPLTPDDALALFLSKLAPYSEQYGPFEFIADKIFVYSRTYERLSRNETEGTQTLNYDKPLTTMGYYNFELHQTFYGIPFVQAYASYEHPIKSETRNAVLQGMIYGDIVTEDDYSLGFAPAIEDMVLVDDVPLTPFSKVKSGIERLISDGYIRRIVKVQLGYVLMNDPNNMNNKFILVPVWEVRGTVVRNPNFPTPELTYEDKYMQDMWNVQYIQFNAQTGTYYDINDTNPTRNNATYLTWDQVK